MKNIFTAKRLCRGGIISALYVALTFVFGALPFQGFLQVRPAEALCILPLFYPEAVPALYIGCMLSNVTSPFFIYDVFIGSLATLLAALITYFIGRKIRSTPLKIGLGGFAPVILNALIIPVIIVFLCGDMGGYSTKLIAYFVFFASLFITESIWVYALGTPLYFFIDRMQKRNVSVFLS